MRVLVFADLHLDAQFAWAGPAAARAWRGRLRRALEAIAGLAREHRADAVLCSGDLYEHERFSPDTSEFVRGVFAGLDPIPVFVSPGNHDWLGPGSMWNRNAWSGNVRVFQADRLAPVEIAPGLTLWGAAHRAPAGTRGFLEGFQVDRGGVNLALFHGSERGSHAAQGRDKGLHAPFSAADIEGAGLHHAFVGHYHNPRDAERFTYPGNPDPLGFGEEGDRGAVLATIRSDGTLERRRFRVGRTDLVDLTADVTGASCLQEVRERIAAELAGRSGLARVTLRGDLATEVNLDRAELARPPHEGIEALQVRTEEVRVAYDCDAIALEPTVRGEFVREVLAAAGLEEPERRAVLVVGLRALEGREDLEAL